VDAVVAGHTHEVFPTECDCDIFPPNAPIVQPGYWGSHLGCIDFALSKSRGGTGNDWSILKAHAEALPLDGENREAGRGALRRVLRRSGPALRRSVGRMHRSARSESRQIGESVVALQTYFSTVAPCRATQLASDAQKAAASRAIAGRRADWGPAGPFGHLTHAQHAARPVHRHPGRTDPAQACLGPLLLSQRARGPSGRGRDLSDWLERAASIFHASTRTTRRATADRPRFAGYNFDRLDGLLYDIDVSRPPGPMPTASGSSTRPGASGTCATPTVARRPRGGNSRRHEFLPRVGRRQLPRLRPRETVFDDTDLVRDTSSISSAPARTDPTRTRPILHLAGSARRGPSSKPDPGPASCRSSLPASDCSPRHPDRRFPDRPAHGPALRTRIADDFRLILAFAQ
jgi:hypothetical protein